LGGIIMARTNADCGSWAAISLRSDQLAVGAALVYSTRVMDAVEEYPRAASPHK
jgi:hypothetical protein